MATSPRKYNKTKGAANTKGQMYETKMVSLLFLRGINSGLDFEIASNVDGAGALDDVVFRYKSAANQPWSTAFIQLKHRDGGITPNMLKDRKSDLGLAKYFKSYGDIQKVVLSSDRSFLFEGSIDDCIFVLFTNAKGNNNPEPKNNLGGRKVAEGITEEFLWTGTGTIISFDPESDSSPNKEVVGSLDSITDSDNDSKLDFIKKFRVFADQPSHEAMDALIKCELGKSVIKSHLKQVDINTLYKSFKDIMLKWCEESKFVLDKDSTLLGQAYVETRLVVEESDISKISFVDDALDPLRKLLEGDFPVVLVKSSERSSLISCSKLLQAINGSYLCLGIEMLLENMRTTLLVCEKEKTKWLIITLKEYKAGYHDKYLQAFREVRQSLSKTRVAVVLCDSPFVGSLVTEFEGKTLKPIEPIEPIEHIEDFEPPSGRVVAVYEDSFEFSHLDQDSQDSILNEPIMFQGCETTLIEMIKDHREVAGAYLNASCVVEILTRTNMPLSVGPNLPDEIAYYVQRKLDRSFVKDSLFSETNLVESITIQYCTKNDILPILLKADPKLEPRCVNEALDSFPQTPSGPAEFDGVVGAGETWHIGMLEFNFLFLRNNEDIFVSALRFRRRSENPSPEPSHAWFLFVPKGMNEVNLKTLEDYHQSQHLLCCKDGNISWIHSSGDIKIIGRHIIDQDQMAPRNDLDLDFEGERVVLICAEPGMGKTTLTKRFARHIKDSFPHLWVIHIALNDHDRLYAEGKHEKVFDFLSLATSIKSDVEMSLLKFALEQSGNLAVILDGCDEISPRHVQECFALLQNIIRTETKKILITSRNSIKAKLEEQTSTLAVNVQHFSEPDKRTFLKQFWAFKSTLSGSELDEFVGQVLHKMSQAISNKEKDFLGVPLQMQIMATVLESHVAGSVRIALPDKLDLLYFVEEFVEKKFRVYLEDKLSISIYDSNYDVHFKAHKMVCDKNHARAALLLIVGGEDLKVLLSEEKIKLATTFLEEIDTCKDNTGIIDSIVDSKPRFIHRVFAEYFVAVWFSTHFSSIPHSFLENRLYKAEYSVVRVILDRILAREHKLHTAVLNKDLESVRSLLEKGEDVNATDLGGRTALHLASAFTPKKDKDESFRRNQILDLLIERTTNFNQMDDLHKLPPVKYADVTQSWTAIDRLMTRSSSAEEYLEITSTNVGNIEMLEYISIHNLGNLVEFFHNEGFTVDRMYFGLPANILPNMIQYLSPEVISKAVGIFPSKQDPLHYASAYNDLEGVKRAVQMQTVSGKHKAINKKDENGMAAIHFAAFQGHVEVVTYLLKHGADPKIHEGMFGSTPVQVAILTRHTDVVRALLEALPDSEHFDYITAPNSKYRYTAFQMATELGREDIVRCFLDTIHAVGGVAAQKVLVRTKRGTGLHAVQLAAFCAQPKIMRDLLSAFDESEVADVMNERDRDGCTLVDLAAHGGSVEIVELVLELGGRLDVTNDKGQTPLMVAAERGHQSVIEFLNKKLSSDFDMD